MDKHKHNRGFQTRKQSLYVDGCDVEDVAFGFIFEGFRNLVVVPSQ
jgi:hypothetical protein